MAMPDLAYLLIAAIVLLLGGYITFFQERAGKVIRRVFLVAAMVVIGIVSYARASGIWR